MRISLPDVLSANAGYVDTAGFLALNGLFTSHVTGNFVTLGSSLVLGTSGALAKVLALPVFCLTVFLLRLLGQRHKGAGHSALRTLLTLQFTLLVAAMATQNAAHRLHLPGTPPSTVMTLTTTQIMLDVGELVHGMASESAAAIRGRLKRLTLSVVMFALGCALAALVFAQLGMWCFLLPPVLGLTAARLPESLAPELPR